VVSVTCPVFFNFASNHIFVIGEATHFKFRVLIDTEEYECTQNILLPKGMCSESREIVCGLSNGTMPMSLNDLEVTFAV